MWEKNIYNSKNKQKTLVKTSIKLQKHWLKKHENFATFMYKCIIKYRCIKYEKNFQKTSIKKCENSLGLRKGWKHEKIYIKLYITFFGNAR